MKEEVLSSWSAFDFGEVDVTENKNRKSLE